MEIADFISLLIASCLFAAIPVGILWWQDTFRKAELAVGLRVLQDVKKYEGSAEHRDNVIAICYQVAGEQLTRMQYKEFQERFSKKLVNTWYTPNTIQALFHDTVKEVRKIC